MRAQINCRWTCAGKVPYVVLLLLKDDALTLHCCLFSRRYTCPYRLQQPAKDIRCLLTRASAISRTNTKQTMAEPDEGYCLLLFFPNRMNVYGLILTASRSAPINDAPGLEWPGQWNMVICAWQMTPRLVH